MDIEVGLTFTNGIYIIQGNADNNDQVVIYTKRSLQKLIKELKELEHELEE